jgi:hypothetical protein
MCSWQKCIETKEWCRDVKRSKNDDDETNIKETTTSMPAPDASPPLSPAFPSSPSPSLEEVERLKQDALLEEARREEEKRQKEEEVHSPIILL